MINKLLKIIFLIGVSFLQAQEPVTVQLSEKNGLPDNEFYSVIEDNNGFIWLCADKGLFRYDGIKYDSYTNQKQKGASLFGVKQDALERIWCNNIAGQFFYVKGNRLELFLDLSKTLKGELADFIVAKNFLWVFTQRTIYKIHLETKKTEIAHQSRESVGSSFYFKDRLFFNYPNENKTANTIYNITENGKIIPLATIRLFKRSGFNQKPKIFSLENKLFYKQKISGINRFFKISLDNKNLKEIQGFSAIAKERIYNEFINNNELWLATNSGVWVYQITDLKATLKKRFLKDKNVTQVIKDKDNNYWLTTLNNGVYLIPNLFIEEEHLSLKNNTCIEKVYCHLLFLYKYYFLKKDVLLQ